jgi:hypothetical protein
MLTKWPRFDLEQLSSLASYLAHPALKRWTIDAGFRALDPLSVEEMET